MPLNLPTGGGDFTPFIKYNAKAGRFYIRVDEQDQEVVNPTLVIDMANIKTGWINFPLAGAPQTEWTLGASPGQGWKEGFKVVVNGDAPIGEREWMSNAGCCNAAMMKMYDMWEARPEHTDPTKVPWYKFVRVEGITGQYGTNYEPIFELAGFTDRAGRFGNDANVETSPMHNDPTPPLPTSAPPSAEQAQGLDNEALSDLPF